MCYGFGMIVGLVNEAELYVHSYLFIYSLLLLLLLLCCECWRAIVCVSDQNVATGNRFSSSTMDSRDRNSGIRLVGQTLLASK